MLQTPTFSSARSLILTEDSTDCVKRAHLNPWGRGECRGRGERQVNTVPGQFLRNPGPCSLFRRMGTERQNLDKGG